MGTTTHLDPEVTVALQGTLDTFALPDVLRLLAATKKSGRLRITGGRGAGSVWVHEGGIGAIEAPDAPHATAPVDALFELLRFEQGSFTFDADVTHDATGGSDGSEDLETLLATAETLLVEWHEIESVVPSMDAWVTLRRDLGSPKATIERSHWRMVVAVGSGATVGRMSEELCLAQLHVSRAVRDLFALGLVDIEACSPPEAAAAAATTPRTVEHPASPAVGENADSIVEDAAAVDAPAAPAPPPAPEAEVATDVPLPDVPLPDVPLPDVPLPDVPLPTARPLRARRSKSGAHLAGPAEPDVFVPLELPSHSSPGSYDPIDGHHEVEPAVGETVEDLAAAFPGLANRTVDPTPDDEGRDDAAPDAAAEGEEAEEQHGNRGLLLKLRSSMKS